MKFPVITKEHLNAAPKKDDKKDEPEISWWEKLERLQGVIANTQQKKRR
jgi:hypothetical protein